MLRRMLLIIGLTLVVMLAIITLVTRTVLFAGFSRLETTFMERNVARVQNAISDELSALGRTTQDWAAWDDTYRFVQDVNRSYIASNLETDTFMNLRLSIMLWLDLRGNEVFGTMFDPASGTLTRAPPSLRDWLIAHPRMINVQARDAHAEAVVPLPEGTFLVATRPIQDSELRKPIRGTLVFARRFDPEEVRRIATSLQLSVTFYTPHDVNLPPEAARALAALSPEAPLFIDTRRKDVFAGYAFLQGTPDVPLLMRIEFPREIYQQGKTTVRFFFLWLVFIGVTFGGIVLLVIQRTVLSRLLRLSARVLSIGTGGESGARVPVEGRDQIAYLAVAINGMLDALEGSTNRLRVSEQRNEAFLDAVPDPILRVSREGTIVDARFPTSLPQDMERWRGFVGKRIDEIAAQFPPGLVFRATEAIRQTLDSGMPQVFDFSIPSNGAARHYQARLAASGADETTVLVRDITAQKQAEESRRREVMVKEIHHRVKNNLQVISSLLALQASSSEDNRTRALLSESRDRVRSMALIHEKLYQSGSAPGAGYAEYVRDLVTQLERSYGVSPDAVALHIEVDDIPMDMDQSVPIGLIINELVSNALSHAFPRGRCGTITISMKRVEGGGLSLRVSDDGTGLPPQVDWRAPTSLGLRIVDILAQQIRAEMTVETGAGTSFTFTFPAS